MAGSVPGEPCRACVVWRSMLAAYVSVHPRWRWRSLRPLVVLKMAELGASPVSAPQLNELSAAALSAAMRGGTEGWGEWGSAEQHIRYVEPINPRRRIRCHCGCKRRATHQGWANGISLIDGCELSIRRWAAGR